MPIIIDEWKQQAPIIKVIFSVVAAFGGDLLSNSLVNNTKLISEEADKQRKNYHDRISPINRHLASLTKELSSIIRSVDGKHLTANEGILLINQLISNLVTTMTDIEDVLGEKLNPSSIFETAQKVEELNYLLASIEVKRNDKLEKLNYLLRNIDSEKDLNKKKKLIKEAKITLAHLMKINPDIYQEDINCPSCGLITQTSIGKNRPASSMAVCKGCGLLFHCHRDTDGNVFASIPGKHVTMQPAIHIIECSCGEKFNAKFIAGDPQKRVCMSCGKLISIDSAGKVEKIIDAEISNVVQANYIDKKLYCSEHACWSFPVQSLKGRIVGICPKLHLLRLENNQQQIEHSN